MKLTQEQLAELIAKVFTNLDEKRARRHVLVVAGVAHGDGAHEGRIVFVQGFLHGAGEL